MEQLQAKLRSLSQRERYILFAMLLAILFFLWDQLLFAPMQREIAGATQQRNSLGSQVQTLRAEMETLVQNSATNPNTELERRSQQLIQELAQLDSHVGQLTENLIPPRQMAEVLEQVLRQETRLRLVKVINLPPVALGGAQAEPSRSGNPATAGAQGVLPAQLYRHGVELELVGEYFETLRYLQALQALPWQILWQWLDYEVDSYPRARIRLRLNTLSLSPGWIGV